jgi:hypothetical protein
MSQRSTPEDNYTTSDESDELQQWIQEERLRAWATGVEFALSCMY